MDGDFGAVRPFEQFVLLTVVELADSEGTPAHSYDVTETAKARMEALDRPPFGGIERQEVITALATLADDGLLTKAKTESPVGKGRPAYELAVDAGDVVATLTDAEDVGPYAATLQG
jgi:hypothetical protein